MSKNTFKIGVVGCGRIASVYSDDPKRKYISTHIGAYRRLRNTEIIAACDIDKKRLDKCLKKWNISRGYTNLRKMLKEEKIDILSICTPPETHYSILKEAAKFSIKGIFCEKPLASTLKDAKKMIKICKKKKIVLQINHQRRFNSLHTRLQNIIKQKKLGGIQQVNFFYTMGVKNSGSHMFDLLRFFFGDVEWIQAIFSKNQTRDGKNPNVDGVLKFTNGLFATFQACDVKKYYIFEINCLFDEGRLILSDSGDLLDFYKVRAHKCYSGHNELYRSKSLLKASYKRDSLINAVSYLVASLGKNRKPISSGKDGLKALQLVNASIASARNGGKRVYLG